MCQLFDRIVYGIPIPALSFLMALKVLNEQRYTREVLREIKSSRLPNDIIYTIDIALVRGKASELRKEWWSSLKGLLPTTFDVLTGSEQLMAYEEQDWIKMLNRDLLWEIADSNQCCLSPRPISRGEEHELVRHVREYLRDLPARFKIVNRAPLSINAFFIDEKAEKYAKLDYENDESFFVVCMPDYILQKRTEESPADPIMINQLDLDNCDVNELEATWGMVERVNVETQWNDDEVRCIRREFDYLLKECDLALGNEAEIGLASKINAQLGWWHVSEVVCDCEEDS